jgi:hypothetical protein
MFHPRLLLAPALLAAATAASAIRGLAPTCMPVTAPCRP